MDNGSLDIINVSVMFKSSLEEAGLFTELGNVGLVIVCEHLVTHDGIGNLQCDRYVLWCALIRIPQP